MITDASTTADVVVVWSAFESFAKGDLAGFAAGFHPDATWNHRNDDRFGGVHRGSDGILAFIAESVELTGGTLQAAPDAVMADGQGHVAVLVRMTGTRPDGRSFDTPQVLLITVDGDRMRHVDQFIGDPPAVTAFWS